MTMMMNSSPSSSSANYYTASAASYAPGEDIPNDPGKMFIGGLSWQTTPESIREYFSQFGELAEVMVMKDPATRRSRGFGFITFSEPGAVEKVLSFPVSHQLDGKIVEPKVAVPRKSNPKLVMRTRKIFVGGLSATTSLEDIKAYFEQFCKVKDAMLAYDKVTNRHRGFGFVTFDNEDVVDKICEIHFHDINGKMVESKKALPKEPRPNYYSSYAAPGSYQLSPTAGYRGPPHINMPAGNTASTGGGPNAAANYFNRYSVYRQQYGGNAAAVAAAAAAAAAMASNHNSGMDLYDDPQHQHQQQQQHRGVPTTPTKYSHYMPTDPIAAAAASSRNDYYNNNNEVGIGRDYMNNRDVDIPMRGGISYRSTNGHHYDAVYGNNLVNNPQQQQQQQQQQQHHQQRRQQQQQQQHQHVDHYLGTSLENYVHRDNNGSGENYEEDFPELTSKFSQFHLDGSEALSNNANNNSSTNNNNNNSNDNSSNNNNSNSGQTDSSINNNSSSNNSYGY